MTKSIQIFKRYEKKYLLNEMQYKQIMQVMNRYMQDDDYPESEIHNIYYDAEDYRMIRASLDKPVYKEKLRLRSYHVPGGEDKVFLELKKKFDGVVYKRRLVLPYQRTEKLLQQKQCGDDSQIGREIQWALDFYQPEPKMYIGYHRIALKGKEDDELRITIDNNLRARGYDLSLALGGHGIPLLDKGQKLMEIKTLGAMPLWLAKALNYLDIMPTTYSKYGVAYQASLKKQAVEKGGTRCA